MSFMDAFFHRTMLLNWGDFDPSGIWQSLATFFYFHSWRGATGIWWVDTRDCVKHPTMHSTASPCPHQPLKQITILSKIGLRLRNPTVDISREGEFIRWKRPLFCKIVSEYCYINDPLKNVLPFL